MWDFIKFGFVFVTAIWIVPFIGWLVLMYILYDMFSGWL